MAKPDINKANPLLAKQALINANFDRKAAYSNYIKLYYRQTGKLAPGCDNKDLQAFYDMHVDWINSSFKECEE